MNLKKIIANTAYKAAKAGIATAKNKGNLSQAGAMAAKAVGSANTVKAINKLKGLGGGAQNNRGGASTDASGGEVNPYDQQLAELEQWRKNQMDYINANTQSAINAINAGRSGIESDYADTMREAYISQQKNKLANNDYLNAMGYSGGLAESTLADIDNTYQNNRLAGYKVRQNALS